MLLLLVLLYYIIASSCTLIAHYPSHLPNPNTNPIICHSSSSTTSGSNGITSSVCDIDNLLMHDSKYFIDNYISSINSNRSSSGSSIYVAVISKMDHIYMQLYGNDITISAKNFASSLYQQWCNSSSSSNSSRNSILIFISTTDDIISIYTSNDIINDDVISNTITKMRVYADQYDYGRAIEVAVVYIDAIINNKANTNTNTNTNTYWILSCIILVIIVYWYSSRRRSKSNASNINELVKCT